MPTTITKIIIGDRHYEANSLDRNPPSFTVSQRCPTDSAAEAVLQLLRSIAASGQIVQADEGYNFTVPASGASSETTGSLTIVGGYVHSLTVSSAAGASTITIDSVGHAPVIAEPVGASPSNRTCG